MCYEGRSGSLTQGPPCWHLLDGRKHELCASRVYDEAMPKFSTGGKFSDKALAVLARSFVELDYLPKEPDMTTLYPEDFLPKR
jgi:hypothetical protein